MLVKPAIFLITTGKMAGLSFSEQLKGWTKRVGETAEKRCHIRENTGYIFLRKQDTGGRCHEACKLQCLRYGMQQVWEDKSRVTAVALSNVFNDFYTDHRQLRKAAEDLFEVVVWETDTEGNAWRRKDLQEKNIAVLGDLATAAEDRNEERCLVCRRHLSVEKGMYFDLL